jgi:hypothetical protein
MTIEDHVVVRQGAMDGKNAFGAMWVLTLPWAHPHWSQYVLHLADLTTPLERPPFIARPGMTHEMLLFALDPANLIKKWAPDLSVCMLLPANQGFQFKADSDDAALARVAELVDRMEARTLSPDTDYDSMWRDLFQDGVTLKSSVFDGLGQTRQ